MQSLVCKEQGMLEFRYSPDIMEQILHFTSSRDKHMGNMWNKCIDSEKSSCLALQKEAKEGKKDKDSDKEEEDSGKWGDREDVNW